MHPDDPDEAFLTLLEEQGHGAISAELRARRPPRPAQRPASGNLAAADMAALDALAACQLETHKALAAPLDMAIPHYAPIFLAGSRSEIRAGRLHNGLDPRIWQLRAPIRGIETSALYGRGAS